MNALLRAMLGVLSAVLILGNCQVIAQQRRTVEIPEQIIDALVTEDEAIRKCLESPGGVSKIFRTELVDLSKDSSSEIMVRGISPCVCGPRKCVNRIYRKIENGYELLLKADFAQEIEVRKYYTNNYRQLWAAVYTHGPFISVLHEYHYNGQQYRLDHCVMRFYVYGEWRKGVQGRVRYHRRPEISYVICEPRNP